MKEKGMWNFNGLVVNHGKDEDHKENSELKSSDDDNLDFMDDEAIDSSETDEDEDEGLGDGKMGRSSHDLLDK
jgi:hypothetical protein